MKKVNFLLAIIAFTLFVSSCAETRWTVTDAKSSKIPLGADVEAIADTAMNAYIEPYKKTLDAEMNEVIGYSEIALKAHKPESLLSDFVADVQLKTASEYLKFPVDVAIVNFGGLRTQIPAGPVTVRNIFELMPFENDLVVLRLKGSDLHELFDGFAAIGGQGVAGVRMGIRNGKAVDVLIGGKPLSEDRVYVVATNNFLAEGNDDMPQLLRTESRVNTGIKIRDMLIDYIRMENSNGRKIGAKIEGRIYSVE